MSLPEESLNKKYSYSDYLTWPEEERWDIIDGVPYMHATPLRIHQEVSGELFYQIRNYLKDKPCKVYAAPFSVRLPKENERDDNASTVVEPDIVVICDELKLDDKGCKGAPDLIIEIVSPSSKKLDRLIKFNKYQEAGIKEYWIVEPEDKLVSIFKLESDNRYGRTEIYSEENKVKVGIFEDLVIDLKEVFKR